MLIVVFAFLILAMMMNPQVLINGFLVFALITLILALLGNPTFIICMCIVSILYVLFKDRISRKYY